MNDEIEELEQLRLEHPLLNGVDEVQKLLREFSTKDKRVGWVMVIQTVDLQVNNGSLEWFVLLQMLGQCVAMAKIMVSFKTNQRNALVLVGQVN